jgi:hypothetical protein
MLDHVGDGSSNGTAVRMISTGDIVWIESGLGISRVSLGGLDDLEVDPWEDAIVEVSGRAALAIASRSMAA